MPSPCQIVMPCMRMHAVTHYYACIICTSRCGGWYRDMRSHTHVQTHPCKHPGFSGPADALAQHASALERPDGWLHALRLRREARHSVFVSSTRVVSTAWHVLLMSAIVSSTRVVSTAWHVLLMSAINCQSCLIGEITLRKGSPSYLHFVCAEVDLWPATLQFSECRWVQAQTTCTE